MTEAKKAAFITGAGTRLGAEMALSLAKKGYHIAIHYRNSKEAAQDVKTQILSEAKVDVALFQADLSSHNQLLTCFDEVKTRFPGLALLLNSASQFYPKSYLEWDSKDWDNMVNLHIKTAFFLSQRFISHCQDLSIEGHIISMTDANAKKTNPNFLMYNISKLALTELTQSLAKVAAPLVRVNGIAPGWILSASHGKNEQIKELTDSVPLQRQGSPRDICEALGYLCDNNYITGQIINVDGGRHLT